MKFFTQRWRGIVPMPVLFWRDMVGVGTFVNMLAAFAGLMLVASGMRPEVAVLLPAATLPYNAFLFLAVWRSPQRTTTRAVTAAGWLAAMTVL